jgi:hypothetical protein
LPGWDGKLVVIDDDILEVHPVVDEPSNSLMLKVTCYPPNGFGISP